jgi:NAD(P)H-dependent FMN reductase
MNVLAFAASNSKHSINKQLVQYAANQIPGATVEIIDINDFEMPLYSADREDESGIPPLAHAFYHMIGEADALLISFAEHNGSYTAAFKNLFDWTSRINQKVYQGRDMVLLATSPGPGGASSVLASAKTSAPYFDGNVKAELSVPSFYEVFDAEKGGLQDEDLKRQLSSALATLSNP